MEQHQRTSIAWRFRGAYVNDLLSIRKKYKHASPSSSARVLEPNTHKTCGVFSLACPDCVACNAFRRLSTVARPLARLVDLDAHVSYHEWNYKGEKELEDKQRIKDYLKNWIKDGVDSRKMLIILGLRETKYLKK